tara:strand:- start:7186 stop:8652 length:1467 start_codon:yes stop_codon:yes gene_type:complete
MATLEEKYIEYQKDAPLDGALSFKDFEAVVTSNIEAGNKALNKKEEVVDTSEELPATDEFSDEQFMVGDNSAGMFNSDPQLGDAFEVMSGTTFEQDENRNERLADLVPDLKKENEALKIELTKNLPDPEKKLIDIDSSSLSAFTKSVGKSFVNIAKEVPKRIDEVAADPEKRKNFIRGLQIINESSGIKPISQAKSPLGSIASGLLKAEKMFSAEEIAKLKAKKKEPRRYPSSTENLLTDTFKTYREDLKNKKDLTKSIVERYNLAKNVAMKDGELPTGILNATFRDLKGVLQELGLGDQYDALAKKFASEDYTQMTLEDQNIFNDLFQAATFEQVVQDVKKLYPVSNKDIDTLLKTKGDISTRPDALIRLIAAQMATNDIAMQSEDIAYKYFELGDLQFERKSILMSEKMIAEKLRKENKVTDTTLEKLFGSAKDVTDAGYITAFYYQNLQAQKADGKLDSFTVFQTAEENKIKKIEEIKKKYNKPE